MKLVLFLWSTLAISFTPSSSSSLFVSAFHALSRTVSPPSCSTAKNATPRTTTTTTTTSVANASSGACTDDASSSPALLSHHGTDVLHDDDNNNDSSSSWATYALLFSSLSDGILPNDDARSFLRYSIANSMLRERTACTERILESSAKFSPCNGPNADALKNIEHCDRLFERGKKVCSSNDDDDDNNNDSSSALDKDGLDSWSEETLAHLLSSSDVAKREFLELRVLYIPTAMYALHPQSANAPGRQRQRARADAKRRRDQLLNLLRDIFSLSVCQNRIHLLAVTLDLEDGSLKHPFGGSESNKSSFPENDIAALTTWQPHLIYVEGGNTFWLQHCVDKGGYATLVKDACTGKNGSAVYCGKSAGAILAGERVDTATWKEWDDPSIVPGKGSYSDWLHCRGLGFVGRHSFFPHMSDAWNETVRDRAKSLNLGGCNRVYCLHEHDACCVIGERKLVFLTSGPN